VNGKEILDANCYCRDLLMPTFRKSCCSFQKRTDTSINECQCTPRPDKVNGKIHEMLALSEIRHDIITRKIFGQKILVKALSVYYQEILVF